MHSEMPMSTFDQVLETISQWPFEQQEILIDMLRQRQIATRRKEMAQNVREARATYLQGEIQAENASDAINHLRDLLEKEA